MEAADPNAHIKEYIRYYRTKEQEEGPGFAVMITGEWGVGKTHTVKAIIEAEKHVWVSLYGLSDTSQIDYEIFRALHPLLSSKKARLFGKVAKGFLRATVKIDLDGNDRADGSVSGKLPDVDLKEFSDVESSGLLIFDDLERSNFQLPEEILGYINSLVEHHGLKAIVIGNEDELYQLESEKEKLKRYKRIREKLIGTTLKVEPDLHSALDTILGTAGGDIKPFFDRNREAIDQFCYNEKPVNFRIVKQVIWDFQRLYAELQESHKNCTSGLSSFFYLFLMVSYAWKQGKLPQKKIKTLETAGISERIGDNKGGPVTDLFERHNTNFSTSEYFLSGQLWLDIVCHGKLRSEELKKQLDESPSFQSVTEEPALLTVAYGLSREDAVFAEALAKLKLQIADRKLISRGEILHAVGISLWLKENVFPEPVDASDEPSEEHGAWKRIVEDWETYFSDLATNGKISPSLEDYRGENDREDVHFGLAIWKNETAEFKNIRAQYINTLSKEFRSEWEKVARDLMEQIPNDYRIFYQGVCSTNHPGVSYYDVPILKTLPAKEFVDTLLKTPAENQRAAMMFFKSRYSGPWLEKLSEEREWFFEVFEQLKATAEISSGITRARIKNALSLYAEPAEQAWEEYTAALKPTAA